MSISSSSSLSISDLERKNKELHQLIYRLHREQKQKTLCKCGNLELNINKINNFYYCRIISISDGHSLFVWYNNIDSIIPIGSMPLFDVIIQSISETMIEIHHLISNIKINLITTSYNEQQSWLNALNEFVLINGNKSHIIPQLNYNEEKKKSPEKKKVKKKKLKTRKSVSTKLNITPIKSSPSRSPSSSSSSSKRIKRKKRPSTLRRVKTSPSKKFPKSPKSARSSKSPRSIRRSISPKSARIRRKSPLDSARRRRKSQNVIIKRKRSKSLGGNLRNMLQIPKSFSLSSLNYVGYGVVSVIRIQSIIRGWITRLKYKRLKKLYHGKYGKMLLKRRNIMKEIIKSEQMYVNNLDALIEFSEKLIFLENDEIPKGITNKIMANLCDIYEMHNEFLQKLLDVSSNVPVCCGDLFMELAPLLKIYGSYTINYKSSIELIQKLKTEYKIDNHFTDKDWNRKILDLFVTPIQRIPRYILLLQNLANNTPHDKNEYSILQDAYLAISRMCDFINETNRLSEAKLRVNKLEKLVIDVNLNPMLKSGWIWKQSKNQWKRRFAILKGNYLYLHTKIDATTMNSPESNQDVIRNVDECTLELIPELHASDNDIPYRFRIHFYNKSKKKKIPSLLLGADSHEETIDWVRRLKVASHVSSHLMYKNLNVSYRRVMKEGKFGLVQEGLRAVNSELSDANPNTFHGILMNDVLIYTKITSDNKYQFHGCIFLHTIVYIENIAIGSIKLSKSMQSLVVHASPNHEVWSRQKQLTNDNKSSEMVEKQTFAFKLVTADTIYTIYLNSEADCLSWIKVIRMCMNNFSNILENENDAIHEIDSRIQNSQKRQLEVQENLRVVHDSFFDVNSVLLENQKHLDDVSNGKIDAAESMVGMWLDIVKRSSNERDDILRRVNELQQQLTHVNESLAMLMQFRSDLNIYLDL